MAESTHSLHINVVASLNGFIRHSKTDMPELQPLYRKMLRMYKQGKERDMIAAYVAVAIRTTTVLELASVCLAFHNFFERYEL